VSALYLGLVHHPVRGRAGETITTAVTNLDVHDIARSARAYDLAGYFVITPIEAQRVLVERILEHWRDGAGAQRIPERSEALARCATLDGLETARREVERREGRAPLVWVTSARAVQGAPAISYREAAAVQGPALLLFGTGHGLASEVLEEADGVLPPIRPGAAYNHLSVRAAVAITLDRLFGDTIGDSD
jgi:tRNA (guanine37-N1)-methyltransferase